MLRIAIVTSEFPVSGEPYRGSPVYQTVLALQRLTSVEVFCVVSTYPRYHLLHPTSFHFSRVDSGYCPPQVRTQYIEYPAFPLLTRPVNGHSCAWRLLPHLQESRPDLILSYWLYPDGYAALLLGEKLGIPVVVCALGFDVSRITDPFTYYMTRKTLKRAGFVLTVSDDLRRRAIDIGAKPGRVRTVHNGCNSAIFHLAERSVERAELGIDQDAQLVIFVGRLEPLKGVRELLDSIGLLIPSHPRLELVCIGDDFMNGKLQQRAGQPDLDGHVRFLGPCSAGEVARWLTASNLLCLPSYSEGCPNVILEALSCGRPVVASDVGGIPEIVDSQCGILVPPRDSARLAQALGDALQQPWDGSAIATRSGRSWDDVAEETYQVCSTLLGGKD